MRPSVRVLLRIRPIKGDQLVSTAVRLPPTASAQPSAKRTVRQTFNETAKSLLERAAAASGLTEATVTSSPLPENLRIEVADKKKTTFWRVSKPERQALRKILREA